MQFGVLHIGIDCHHQIPISLLSHQIFLFRFAICLVGPRLYEGDHVLGVCLTSLGRVVGVYVVLVLAEGHSLVVIPEMGEEVYSLVLKQKFFLPWCDFTLLVIDKTIFFF